MLGGAAVLEVAEQTAGIQSCKTHFTAAKSES